MNKRDTHRSRAGAVEPRLPHERDESSGEQAAEAAVDPQAEHAHGDAQRGAPDTDRAPVVDRLYNDKVRPNAPRKRLR